MHGVATAVVGFYGTCWALAECTCGRVYVQPSTLTWFVADRKRLMIQQGYDGSDTGLSLMVAIICAL